VTFKEPQFLHAIISRISAGLDGVEYLNLCVPQWVSFNDKKMNMKITKIGICAGSGGSMLNGLDVDMLFTGELSHHEALAAIEEGKVVVTTFHSNSERAYLDQVMRPALWQKLGWMMGGVPANIEPDDIDLDIEHPSKEDNPFEVFVSKVDRDPFEVVGLQ
jgi:putative NIF3 family GTP cyclohydrolase 1 type 2